MVAFLPDRVDLDRQIIAQEFLMQGAQRYAKSATTAPRNGRRLNLVGGLFTDWLFEVTAELEAHRGEELILVVRFAA